MRLLFRDGNRADVERVARGGFKRADSAFAENHPGAAVNEEIFRRVQPLFDCCGHPALEEDGASGLGDVFEEVVVLAVARADLNAVRHFRDGVDRGDADHFGHDGDMVFVLDRLQNVEPFLSESLEVVGGGAWFERAAAQDADAVGGESGSGNIHLFRGFNGAGACDDLKFFPADFLVPDSEYGIFRMNFPACEFVLFLDRVDVFDAGDVFEGLERHVQVLVSHRTENGMFHAFDETRLVPHVRNHFLHFLNFGFRTVRLENNNHFLPLSMHFLSLYSSKQRDFSKRENFHLQNSFSELHYIQ